MLEWLNATIVYWHWIIFGIALVLCEIFVPMFFFLWLGAAAVVVGALTFLFPIGVAWQLLLWAVFSLLSLIGWFQYVAPRFRDKTRSGMALEAIVGQIGTVLEYNPSTRRGVMRFSAPLLGSDEWPFIDEEVLVVGDRVKVTGFSGNDLLVKKN